MYFCKNVTKLNKSYITTKTLRHFNYIFLQKKKNKILSTLLNISKLFVWFPTNNQYQYFIFTKTF